MFFKKSLFIKMFLNAMAVLVAYSIIVVGGTQIYVSQIQLKRTLADLDKSASQAHDIIIALQPTAADPQRGLELLAGQTGVIIIVFKDGKSRYSTNAQFEGNEILPDRTIKSDLDAQFRYEKAIAPDGESAFYIMCSKTTPDGYTVTVRQNLHFVNTYAFSLQRVSFWFVIMAAGISIFWALAYSRWFTKPISVMNSVTRELAHLNFNNKIPIDREDEVGQLAVSINEMSDKLSSTLEELRQKNEQLTAELERERALENMRKKFVSDVSHELKTPLAIIRGYAEALELSGGKNPAKFGKYTSAIIDETGRMNKLVLDLLDLSNYQSGNYVLKLKRFDISKLLIDISEKYNAIAKAEAVRLDFYAEPCEVCADPGRIEQVLINTLSNATSHASDMDGNGKCMRLSGKHTDDRRYRISVFNSGEHIADDDLDKIWTPFYRADAARNRDSERYGIGLSIVKALLDLHKSEFAIANTDGGVEFYFYLSAE